MVCGHVIIKTEILVNFVTTVDMAEVQYWQSNKTALACHKYMLENSVATDVTFVVSDQVYGCFEGQSREDCNQSVTFKAHK